MSVLVVLVADKLHPYTERAIASLEPQPAVAALRVVTSEPEAALARRLEGRPFPVEFVAAPEPFNLAAAYNAGAAEDDHPAILFLHDDVELPDELAVLRLSRGLERWPRLGIVGPKTDTPQGNRQQAARWNAPFVHTTQPLKGFCLLVRRELFAALGGFDEAFADHGWHDLDFERRAVERGWQLGIANTTVRHLGYATYGQKPGYREDPAHYDWRNKHRFAVKHQVVYDSLAYTKALVTPFTSAVPAVVVTTYNSASFLRRLRPRLAEVRERLVCRLAFLDGGSTDETFLVMNDLPVDYRVGEAGEVVWDRARAYEHSADVVENQHLYLLDAASGADLDAALDNLVHLLVGEFDCVRVRPLSEQLTQGLRDREGFTIHLTATGSLLPPSHFLTLGTRRARSLDWSPWRAQLPHVVHNRLHLTVLGTVRYGDGYGSSCEYLLRALLRTGAKLYLYREGWWDSTDIDPRVYELVWQPKLLTRWGLAYYTPTAWHLCPAPYRLGFTMVEGTRVPPEWVQIINAEAAVCAVPCEQNRQAFLDSGVTRPVEVVRLGVDPEVFYYGDHRDPSRFTFGMAGTLNFRKGADLAIQAFQAAFPKEVDVRLQIKSRLNLVPPFDDWRITAWNEDWPKAQLRAWYQSLDCFLAPSRGEGFGLPPVEAMACGTPAILTNWGGMAEYANAEYGYPLDIKGTVYIPGYSRVDMGECAEPDLDHLIHLMRYVYEHREEVREKGRRAAQIVRRDFTYHHTARRIIQILEEQE